jgi:hypothetical protein
MVPKADEGAASLSSPRDTQSGYADTSARYPLPRFGCRDTSPGSRDTSERYPLHLFAPRDTFAKYPLPLFGAHDTSPRSRDTKFGSPDTSQGCRDTRRSPHKPKAASLRLLASTQQLAKRRLGSSPPSTPLRDPTDGWSEAIPITCREPKASNDPWMRLQPPSGIGRRIETRPTPLKTTFNCRPVGPPYGPSTCG